MQSHDTGHQISMLSRLSDEYNIKTTFLGQCNSGMFVISSIRCIGVDFIAPVMIRSAGSELCLRSDR
jgi:hypothetical protein